MTYRVIIQPEAERDIRQAAAWIREQTRSPAPALHWVRGLRAAIETLASHPLRCPVDPDSEFYGEEVRVLLYGRRRGVYRVLFAVRDRTAHVLTVRHSARQNLADEAEDP